MDAPAASEENFDVRRWAFDVQRSPKLTAFAISATASAPPSAPRLILKPPRAVAPPTAPVAKAPHATPHCAVPVSKPSRWPANVFAKSVCAVGLCGRHSPRSCAFSRKFCLWPADGVLLRPAAPPKARWRWPASCCARHVCLCAPSQSPRAQTLRPVCWRIFPRARLCARVRWCVCPA